MCWKVDKKRERKSGGKITSWGIKHCCKLKTRFWFHKNFLRDTWKEFRPLVEIQECDEFLMASLCVMVFYFHKNQAFVNFPYGDISLLWHKCFKTIPIGWKFGMKIFAFPHLVSECKKMRTEQKAANYDVIGFSFT